MMPDSVKEVMVNNFINELKNQLMDSIKKTPDHWWRTEYLWLFKDITNRFSWYPMIEKRKEQYKNYLLDNVVK